MLGMYQRVFFGPVTHDENRHLQDLSAREWACILPPLIFIFLIGVYPAPFLKKMNAAVTNYAAAVERDGTLKAHPAMTHAAQLRGISSEAANKLPKEGRWIPR
jgi:NADH-quinone oxidoreductase subunit M